MISKTLPIRLHTEVYDRLEKDAKALGLNRTALIKVLIETWIEFYDARNGKGVLPVDWAEMLLVMDGRRRPGSEEAAAGPVPSAAAPKVAAPPMEEKPFGNPAEALALIENARRELAKFEEELRRRKKKDGRKL